MMSEEEIDEVDDDQTDDGEEIDKVEISTAEGDFVSEKFWYRDIHPQTGEYRGFYHRLSLHSIAYVERSTDQLVISFDNLQSASNKQLGRGPWGYSFFKKYDWSVLGVMTSAADWFRNAELIAYLEKLRDDGFFARFKQVSLTGSSMGGHAALVFSRLIPGSIVVAFSPQSTLNRKLVPWEKRWLNGQAQNWDLPYSDAREGLESAKQIYIVYDPLLREDRGQMKRLPDLPNITYVYAIGCGHKTPVALRRMGLLEMVQHDGILGTLNMKTYRKRSRIRRTIMMYRENMRKHLNDRGQPERAEKLRIAFQSHQQRVRRWKRRQLRRQLRKERRAQLKQS